MDDISPSPTTRSRRRSDVKTRDTKLPARHQSLNAPFHSSSAAPHRSHTVDHTSLSRRDVTESRTQNTSRTHSQSNSLAHQNPAASRQVVGGSIGPNTVKTSQQMRIRPIPLNVTSISSRPLPGGSFNHSVQNPISVQSVSESRVTAAPRRAFASIDDGFTSSLVPSQPSTSSHTSANLRMHAASRVVPGSSSRMTPGASSDREVNGHLDLKRLLSKPALPSHSGSSIISIPSDSELPASRRAMTSNDTIPPRKLSLSAPSLPRERNPTKSASAPQPSRSTSVKKISPHSSSEGSGRDTVPKPRNVLRRKSSAHSSHATPTAATFYDDPPETPRPSSSVKPITNVSQTSRSLGSSSKRPMTQPALGAVPTRGFKPKDSKPSASLTPAGAVAHAYKQQEQRREEFEQMVDDDQSFRRVGDPSVRHSLKSFSLRDDMGDESPKGPYYTVFGSSSERVLPAQEDWGLSFGTFYGDDRPGTAQRTVVISAQGHQPSPSGVRSLSRKVSGKFRKATGRHNDGSKSDIEGIGQERSWTPFDGRPGIPETPVKQQGSVFRPSVDIPRDISSYTSSTDKFCSPDSLDGERGKQRDRSVRSPIADEDSPRSRHREEESSPGGKLWKLMKRISTGGLRDKYHGRESTPPPVPALPKNLQPMSAPRLTLDIHKTNHQGNVGETGVLLTRFMQSRASLSGVRPSTAPGLKERVPHEIASRPSTSKGSTTSPSAPRPSTTTRSSSPMSSASPRFHRPHSNRSSTTSYGEEVPPLPSTPGGLGQQIVSPSDLLDTGKDKEVEPAPRSPGRPKRTGRSRSVPGEDTGFNSAEEPRPSLPIPPRRPVTSSGLDMNPNPDRAPSPTIPLFSTSESVNNFPHALSMTEFGVIANPNDAPPRPRRSSRRHPGPLNISLSSLQTPSTPSPTTPRRSILPSLSIDLVHRTRKSMSSSNHRMSPQTASPPQSTSSQSRSPLTFRELESPRQQLSEKEKNARWDDLLARSERAGGTLHIGESGLMSDNIRFSAAFGGD
ncbi:hypothetical protein QCA50_008884 [Cerrena zonata]|uniref:Uncharacterized protein n=1 Tax=Cerrena zonata TaxID=2478898 RepID=A0AAW0GC11_9APHY